MSADPHVLLGRIVDAATDLNHMALKAEKLMAALAEADRIMGHDDAETEWREKWAHLWK